MLFFPSFTHSISPIFFVADFLTLPLSLSLHLHLCLSLPRTHSLTHFWNAFLYYSVVVHFQITESKRENNEQFGYAIASRRTDCRINFRLVLHSFDSQKSISTSVALAHDGMVQQQQRQDQHQSHIKTISKWIVLQNASSLFLCFPRDFNLNFDPLSSNCIARSFPFISQIKISFRAWCSFSRVIHVSGEKYDIYLGTDWTRTMINSLISM